MVKIIRVCEITGKVTTIADGLDRLTAIAIVKENAKNDNFGFYMILKR